MFLARLITGLALATAALYSIFYLPTVYIVALVGVVYLLAIFEWANLIGFEKSTSKLAISGLMVLLSVTVYILIRYQVLTLFSVLYFALVWWMLALILTVIYPKSKEIFSIRLISFLAGFLTLIPSYMAIIYICDSAIVGRNWLIFLLFVIWANDVGAYFIGKMFGKKKLAENISPGKTWEGVVGGLLFAIVVSFIAHKYEFISGFSFGKVFTLTILVSIFGIVGDLQESIFKRIRGVKDSGTILPGHGGILDRIDSLTAGAPMFLVFFSILY